jgi:hypothetical protein
MAGLHITEDDLLFADGDVSVTFNSSTGNYVFDVDADILASVAGNDTEIQFNDQGTFGSSPDLTFDANIGDLSVGEPGQVVLGNPTSTEFGESNFVTGFGVDIADFAIPAKESFITGVNITIPGVVENSIVTGQGSEVSNIGFTFATGNDMTYSGAGFGTDKIASFLTGDGGTFGEDVEYTFANVRSGSISNTERSFVNAADGGVSLNNITDSFVNVASTSSNTIENIDKSLIVGLASGNFNANGGKYNAYLGLLPDKVEFGNLNDSSSNLFIGAQSAAARGIRNSIKAGQQGLIDSTLTSLMFSSSGSLVDSDYSGNFGIDNFVNYRDVSDLAIEYNSTTNELKIEDGPELFGNPSFSLFEFDNQSVNGSSYVEAGNSSFNSSTNVWTVSFNSEPLSNSDLSQFDFNQGVLRYRPGGFRTGNDRVFVFGRFNEINAIGENQAGSTSDIYVFGTGNEMNTETFTESDAYGSKFAFGNGLNLDYSNEVPMAIFGEFNEAGTDTATDNDKLFVIGNGNNDGNRSDGFVFRKNGDIEITEPSNASNTDQVLVRNPTTGKIEKVSGSQFSGGGNGSSTIQAGLGLSSTFNASTGETIFDVVASGNDNEVQFNDNGSLGASPDLAFNGSSLISSGFTVQPGGTFDMGFVPDIPTTVNVQHSNSGNFFLTWFVLAETPGGLLTARDGDFRQSLPTPDSSNPVEVNWQENSSAEKYYVIVEQFDSGTFSLDYRLIAEITDTTTTSVVDTGQGTLLSNFPGLDQSDIPQQNETFGKIFFTTRQISSSAETGGLLMNADVSGEVARTPGDRARYEGSGAFTFGQRDSAQSIGNGSFAAGGTGLIATGEASIALGENTEATSTAAVALGSGSRATDIGAFAAGQGAQATDSGAVALGLGTQAVGTNCVAEGNSTVAGGGAAAHAEGFRTEALGTSSHSEGSDTLARGRSSHAGGDNTVAWPYASRVVGFFNEDYLGGLTQNPPPAQQGIEDFQSLSERIFAVGVGENPSTSPGDGNYIDGRGRVDGLYVTVREGTHIRHGLSLDSYNASLGDYETELRIGPEISEGTDASQVLVRNPNTNELEYVDGSTLGSGGETIVAGTGLESVFNPSTGDTTFNVDPIISDTESDMILRDSSTGELITLDGSSAFAKYEGNGAFTLGSRAGAVGANSVAMGENTEASGGFSTAIGAGTEANGFYSIAMGISTIANANQSVAMGSNTETSGIGSTAMGIYTEAKGYSSTAMGNYTISRTYAGIAQGVYNEDYLGTGNEPDGIEDITPQDRLLAVGVGDNPSQQGFGSEFNDGLGRADGLYVTYRDGTYVREGLTVERFQVNDSTGEYIKNVDGVTQVETVLSIGREIAEGTNASQVLVRNPSTKELEYIDASNFSGGGGSTNVVGGIGIDSSYNASTDAFTVELSDVVAKAVDFGGSVRVTSGEMEVTTPGLGQILKSPDGTRFRVKVKNDGTIVSEEL